MRWWWLLAGIGAWWWWLNRQEDRRWQCSSWERIEADGRLYWRCADQTAPEAILVEYQPPPPEALEVARLASQRWPVNLAILMTAIAGQESRWDPAARGDRRWGRWSCQGYQSWGLWQIRMPIWRDVLIALGAPRDPCQMAAWLMDPENNALAAAEVLRRQGLEAWTAYTSGAYQQFLGPAISAVVAVYQPPGPVLA